MVEPPRSLAFDRIADRYDATRGGDERASGIAGALAPELPPGPVLEVGVGTGSVAAAVTAARPDQPPVVGVDLSLPMLARARERLGPRVAVGDAHRLPVADRSVAAAYLVWVLHLVGDVAAVLAECRRVLAPGGRLLVVPADRSASDPRTDLDAVLDGLMAAVRPDPADTPDRVIPLAERADLTLQRRLEFATRRFGASPAEVAERVETRAYSWLWGVDPRTWSVVVEPAVARLRALPDPQVERHTTPSHHLVVFAAPVLH